MNQKSDAEEYCEMVLGILEDPNMNIETNLECIKRLEREKFELVYTLRQVYEIERHRLELLKRSGKEAKPAPWVEEVKDMLLKYDT